MGDGAIGKSSGKVEKMVYKGGGLVSGVRGFDCSLSYLMIYMFFITRVSIFLHSYRLLFRKGSNNNYSAILDSSIRIQHNRIRKKR